MSIRPLTALGLVLVASTASAQYPADDPVQFAARCTFERDGADALRMLCGFGAQNEVEALFTKHAQAHGWSWDIEGPDLADFGRAARCPGWMLDQLAGVGDVPCSSGSIFVDRAIAVALARNGRVEDALRLVESGIEDVQFRSRRRAPVAENEFAIPPEWIARQASDGTSYLSQWAAKIAARGGRWDRALDFAKDWTPTSWCGFGISGEASEIRNFSARCLVALGRCDEAVALARESARDDSWGRASPTLIALWIECSMSTRRACNAEAALDAILAETPEQAHEVCRSGMRAWQLARMPREEQLAHLEDLAQFAPDKSLALLLSSGSLAIVARLGAFEVVEEQLREPALARVLAETGHPDVGPVLLLASERVPSFKYELDVWMQANERWHALAQVR